MSAKRQSLPHFDSRSVALFTALALTATFAGAQASTNPLSLSRIAARRFRGRRGDSIEPMDTGAGSGHLPQGRRRR